MGKNSKARATKAYEKKQSNKLFWLIAIPLSALVIKLIVMANTQGGGWLGADGENYLSGVDGLIAEGYFSEKSILSYWPAGYPLVILFLSLLGKSCALTTLSIVQSLIFSYAVYFFATELSKTKLKKFSYLVLLLILLNPTLSLSSIAVGYESLTASGLLFCV